MRIWASFWFFALTVAHAQNPSDTKPKQNADAPPIRTLFDATLVGKPGALANIEDYFWAEIIPRYKYYFSRTLYNENKPRAFLEEKLLEASWDVLPSLEGRGRRHQSLFYERIIADVLRANPINAQVASALEDLERRLSLNSATPTRELARPRSDQEIDTRSNNVFQSTYLRPRRDSLYPLDRFNFTDIKKREAYDEEPRAAISWKSKAPPHAEETRKIVKDEITRLIAELKIQAIRDFLPLGLDYNEAHRREHQANAKIQSFFQKTPKAENPPLLSAFGFLDTDGKFRPLEDFAKGRFRPSDQAGVLEFLPEANLPPIRIHQSQLTLRRQHASGDPAPGFAYEPRKLDEDTIQLFLAKEHRDPQWILRPPEKLARLTLGKVLARLTLDRLEAMQSNMTYAKDEPLMREELRVVVERLHAGLGTRPNAYDWERESTAHLRHNFVTFAETMASSPRIYDIRSFDLRSPINGKNRLESFGGTYPLEFSSSNAVKSRRLILWSRLLDEQGDWSTWIEQEQIAHKDKRPSFYTALAKSNNYEKRKVSYHRALRYVSDHRLKFASTMAILGIGAGTYAGFYKFSDASLNKGKSAESAAVESVESPDTQKNHDTFGDGRVIEAEPADPSFWDRFQDWLPAVKIRSSGQAKSERSPRYRPGKDADDKPDGTGFGGDNERAIIYEVSGKDATGPTLIYEATPQELQNAPAATVNFGGDTDIVLKGTYPQGPSEGFLALHTPHAGALTRLELRSPAGKLIPPTSYQLVRASDTGHYGVKFLDAVPEAVVPNLAFDSDGFQMYNFRGYSPELGIDADRMSEISTLLREAGFTEIANGFDLKIRAQPERTFTPQDVAAIVKGTSVYTHARAPELVVDEATLARNEFLKFSNFVIDGIACGECDMGQIIVDTILRKGIPPQKDLWFGLRSSLVIENGKVTNLGHVEGEAHYRASWGNHVVSRYDGTPKLQPTLDQLDRLFERDRLAAAEDLRKKALGISQKPEKDPAPFEHAYENPAAPFTDRRRRDPQNLHPEMDYVPFDLRPELAANSPSPPTPVAKAPKLVTPKPKPPTPKEPPIATVAKTEETQAAAAATVKRLGPTEEELWQKRWRERLQTELTAQANLLAKRKLSLSDTPLLKPLSTLTSHLLSYANGNLSFTALYQNVTGNRDAPEPRVAAKAILEKIATDRGAIDSHIARVRREPNLVRRAPELAEKPLLEKFSIETPNLLRQMMYDMPTDLHRCTEILDAI